jgi:hypothetical protein
MVGSTQNRRLLIWIKLTAAHSFAPACHVADQKKKTREGAMIQQTIVLWLLIRLKRWCRILTKMAG